VAMASASESGISTEPISLDADRGVSFAEQMDKEDLRGTD